MMQRIEIPNTVNSPNFISSWMLNDTDMCDEIVNFFEANHRPQINSLSNTTRENPEDYSIH